MKYPTLEQVELAHKPQLGKWLRFLDSPGMSAINECLASDAIEARRVAEAEVMERIRARFAELGGWTPALSKAIGWN